MEQQGTFPLMFQGTQSQQSPPAFQSQLQSSGQARPYRSHKVPACDRCRKRKLRCAVDVPGQPCHFCRVSSATCNRTQKGDGVSRPGNVEIRRSIDQTNPPSLSSVRQPAKRRYVSSHDGTQRPGSSPQSLRLPISSASSEQHYSASQTRKRDRTPLVDGGSKSAMIVGPVMAEDVQVIEKYMSSHDHTSPHHTRQYDTVSDKPQDPVLYLTVPRRRKGLALHTRPGETQREILEQILGPHVEHAIGVYFEYIHPSFPVIDEENFIHLYKTGNKSLSAALVCDILASSLIYWHRSKDLQPYPCPDLPYVWNLAVAALQEEFLAPGMSTIHAALLDLGGRPTTSITGNTIGSGRTVALSHVLGLNRNPQSWKISESEKNMRVRLWWGVLIHDRWSSFAHGVPTYVTKNQYEVPVPSAAVLMTCGMETAERKGAAKCFIALCTLTEILGDILPLVYDRRDRTGNEVKKTLRRLETDLDKWEDSEPALSILRGREEGQCVSGSSSLMLGLLSVKMLICRVAFRNATHSPEPSLIETQQYSEAMLRESARAITTFLCSLSAHHLFEYWTPYTAYHIASATIILLRCTIETRDPLVSDSCKTSLTSFLEWLRLARSEYRWDLADICLAQCEGAILEVCGNHHHARVNVGSGQHLNMGGEEGSLVNDQGDEELGGLDPNMFHFNGYNGGVHSGPSVMDTQNSVNGFEYPWAELWDLF